MAALGHDMASLSVGLGLSSVPVLPPGEPSESLSHPPIVGLGDHSYFSRERCVGVIALEDILPHPKAPARKTVTGNRKKGSTRVLTDTPVKNALEKEQAERSEKKTKLQRLTLKRIGLAHLRKNDRPQRRNQQMDHPKNSLNCWMF